MYTYEGICIVYIVKFERYDNNQLIIPLNIGFLFTHTEKLLLAAARSGILLIFH